MIRSPILLTCFSLLIVGAFTTTTQAQTFLFGQTFDGTASGTAVPAGAGQTFITNTGAVSASNTNTMTLFPTASSASSVTGGDAATNYITFGTVAASRLRTGTIANFATSAAAGLFSVVYDTNIPSTGTGGALLSIVNSSATDVNAGTGTFNAFTLNNTGAVTASGTGATLTGGTATVPLNTQFVLSLVVNATTGSLTYTNAPSALPAGSTDIYAATLAGGTTYVGRLTAVSATIVPQQLGFANFNGTTPNDRFNEVDVITGATIATIPEPGTYALLAVGGLMFVVLRRRRLV